MISSSSHSIQAAFNALSEPLRISGVSNTTVCAYVAARLNLPQPGAPLIIICPDFSSADQLAEEMNAFVGEVSESSSPIAVSLPTWENTPYSSISLSIRVRHHRIALLSRLGKPNGPQVITTTLEASLQSTLPPDLLQQSILHLKTDEEVESRERLIQDLYRNGYLKVDTVDDAGTFAVRGDIIDVLPPGLFQDDAWGIRIELWGETIEQIRLFHPETQRVLQKEGTSNSLLEISLPPAREVLIRTEDESKVRERIKSFADNRDIPRKLRDPILHSIQQGTYAQKSDTWAPFVYEEPHHFWSHIDSSSSSNYQVLWFDELSCFQNWDKFLEKQAQSQEAYRDSGMIVPDPNTLYQGKSALESAIQHTQIYFDRIDFTELDLSQNPQPVPDEKTPIRSKHTLSIRENTDLHLPSQKTPEEVWNKLKQWNSDQRQVLIFSSSEKTQERLVYLLQEKQIPFTIQEQGLPENALPGIFLKTGRIQMGFRWPVEKTILLRDDELFGTKKNRTSLRRHRSENKSSAQDWSGLQTLSDLNEKDVVVHRDHGVARYLGLKRLKLSGAESDFLVLEYAGGDKLYVPIYRLQGVQKHSNAQNTVKLDKLGGSGFEKTKAGVKKAVKTLAFNLVDLYARRQIQKISRYLAPDTYYTDFEERFPFEETPDQLKAIEESLEDMREGKVMDRLICGDVGFGKTEVAMRAAFLAVENQRQVAVLVPTTILCFQHEQSFRERFKDYPVEVESLSRFKPRKEQKRILADVSTGKIDILIGTHRLLSQDVRFKNLGLMIVDEEHRFGVEHKEKLKNFRTNTHVMTLTATPIPRTLHMSLAGLRDISLITTPPVDRMPIRTYVSKFDETLIQRALEFELSRGGQVYFLHNRVQSIYEMAARIEKLCDKAKVIVGHGQMTESQLEKTMLSFYKGEANVLVCTTIIESGIDIPSANTIIINRADSFGLAQLYQLRGRVGRSGQRAYAYLLVSEQGKMTEDAKKRLEVIQRFVELGSGFHIASHDLEIRGGGNLLGAEQSGHIASVGFDLYTELLEEAIDDIRKTKENTGDIDESSALSKNKEPEMRSPYPAYLDESYIPDPHQRLSLYRRLSISKTEEELFELEDELKDRFGKLPEPAQNLVGLIRIKQLLQAHGVELLTIGKERVSLSPGPVCLLSPEKLLQEIKSGNNDLSVTPESKIILRHPQAGLNKLFFALESLFKTLKR